MGSYKQNKIKEWFWCMGRTLKERLDRMSNKIKPKRGLFSKIGSAILDVGGEKNE